MTVRQQPLIATLRAAPLWLAAASVTLVPVAAAFAQAAEAPAQRSDQLMKDVLALQSEVTRLKKRVAELEAENAALRAGEKPAGAGATGKGKSPGGGESFAATPEDPLAGPEAALAFYRKEYTEKVGDLPRTSAVEKERAIAEVGKWARAAKKQRGRVEWIIEVKEATPDPLKGGGTLRFRVVNPVDRKAYSELIVSQPLSPGQFRPLADKPDEKYWKLTGVYSAEARVTKDAGDDANNPMFIGPNADMVTTLSVQTVTPAANP